MGWGVGLGGCKPPTNGWILNHVTLDEQPRLAGPAVEVLSLLVLRRGE